jgi:acetyltransferase-like isoleucine patch superfamily enzyme
MKQRLFRLFNLAYRLQVRLWTWFYKPFLGRLGRGSRLERVSLLTNPDCLFLGENVGIAHGARIEAFRNHREYRYAPSITIGDGSSIQPYVHLAAAANMVIGCHVLMGSRVFITDHDHQFLDPDVPVGEQALEVAPVQIEDFVWLGENVVVLKGVTIGHHAVVGANSVVTRDLPPYAVAAGAPAHVIRMRAQSKAVKDILLP